MATFYNVLPMILIFLVGVIIRRTGILALRDGEALLKVVFNITAPALFIASVSQLKIGPDVLMLPPLGITMFFGIYLLALPIGKLLRLPRPTLGTFLLGSSIMNVTFVLPFFVAVYGIQEAGRISFLDLGNALVVFTFGYALACRMGENQKRGNMAARILTSPPIIGIIIGLVLNLFSLHPPAPIMNTLTMVGTATLPMVMLALGMYFSPKVRNLPVTFIAVSLRMLLGFGLGLLLANLLGLTGINRMLLLLTASAPAGTNTLTFSVLEKLDTELASSIVSMSILSGLVVIPLILLVA
ncbi:AEC family transporter [Deinococcus cellulosilyticus]|uniref:Transporter n=1 Tax=Deinococcus cellulosilyticus (strain DSM 18568 / NBRC 106333 / KACC 11606 / 5516J-15) TaxID=1223518 RepID=A0A511N063_DEIC1|nr:AEC family transporter [Deinococcus cellulosilyticus]GEM45776.1 transporter [Deinococcus cellulosilyticus NBRC 106333 = KACC 11606]